MKSYILTGTLLLLSGVGCYGAGGLLLKSTLDRQGIQTAAFARAERSCREQVVKLGKVSPLADDMLEIDVADVSDPRSALAQATSILAICPTRQIAEVCLGTACSKGGGLGNSVHMTIKLSGVKK